MQRFTATILLSFSLMILVGVAPALGQVDYDAHGQVNFTTMWDSTETTNGEAGSYVGSSTYVRAFGAGFVNQGDGSTAYRVLVPRSNGSSLAVRVVNGNTGEMVDTLDLDLGNTIPEDTWEVRDVDVTDDGEILVSKLVTNDEADDGSGTQDSWRLWRWEHEHATPAELSFDGSPGYSDGDGTEDRIGVFTAVGSFEDNSLTVWAAEDGGSQVHRFEWDGSGFSSTAISVGEVIGDYPKVAPKGTGAVGFYLNSDGMPGYEFSASGGQENELSDVGLTDSTEAITRFTHGGDEYLLVHNNVGGSSAYTFDPSVDTTSAKLVNVTDGTIYGRTADQSGSGDDSDIFAGDYDDVRENEELGDVAVRDNGDGTYTAYVFTQRDGVGAYTTDAGPLPVEMASFGVEADGKQAVLSWQTASETNNAGFEVQHQGPGASSWENLGFAESRASGGTTTQSQTYRFTTEALEGGTHTFRLRQVDTDGSATLTEVRTVQIAGEAGLKIDGPNPVMQGRSLSVTVRAGVSQPVEVALYNALGQRVQTVASGTVSSGRPLQKQLSTENLSSGLYFLRVHGDALQETRRITVVR